MLAEKLIRAWALGATGGSQCPYGLTAAPPAL